MRRNPIHWSLVACLAVSCFCQIAYAESPESAAARVRAAANALDAWLDGTTAGAGWHRYLRSAELGPQVPLGSFADADVLRRVQERYASGKPGLDLPRFAAVRTALDEWIRQLEVPSTAELPALAREHRDRFEPTTDLTVLAEQRRLHEALERLDDHLSRRLLNGDAWKRYIHWTTLRQQAAADAPDLAELSEIYRRMASGHRGLHRPAFNQARRALRSYLLAVDRLRASGLDAEYTRVIDDLTARLEQYQIEPSTELREDIALLVGWLESRNQAAPLIRAVRGNFAQPNLLVSASAGLVAYGFNEPVNDVEPVRDVILGTRISGTGHTTGRVSVRLLPSNEGAVLETIFTGVNRSRTLGVNGPARISSAGTTQLYGRKRLVLTAEGVEALPTVASADTRTRTLGVSNTFGCLLNRLVNRIATKRVAESKRQGELIGSRHAEERLANRIDQRAAGTLVQVNDAFWGRFRQPLVAREQFPPLLHFRTNERRLYVTGVQANSFQLASPTPPPTLLGVSDLAIRVHESMLNNLVEGLLAGQTIREEDVQTQMIELRGELPERFKSEEGKEPWSITFPPRRPITFKFDDDLMSVTIRGQSFTTGDRPLRSMNISATYRLERISRGLRAVRQGDLTIVPPPHIWDGKRRFSAQEQSLRNLLERRMSKLLSEEFLIEDLILPGRWEAAGTLLPVQLAVDDGWLLLSVQRESTLPIVARTVSRTTVASNP